MLVGGGCYCCTAVPLLHSPAVTRARRRPFARSIAPSIARHHRRPGVLGPLSSIARRRPIARSPARPSSLARRRLRRSGGLLPPSSLARRRPLARSPAVARSLAGRRSPAVARPPPLLLLLIGPVISQGGDKTNKMLRKYSSTSAVVPQTGCYI